MDSDFYVMTDSPGARCYGGLAMAWCDADDRAAWLEQCEDERVDAARLNRREDERAAARTGRLLAPLER